MAPSGHRRNLQTKSSSEIFSRNFHPCRTGDSSTGDSSTGDSLYKFGRTNTAVFGITLYLRNKNVDRQQAYDLNQSHERPGLISASLKEHRGLPSACFRLIICFSRRRTERRVSQSIPVHPANRFVISSDVYTTDGVQTTDPRRVVADILLVYAIKSITG